MRHIGNQTIIITNMTDLCKFMRKEHIEIVSMKPISGMYGENVLKVEYKYRKEEG